tara:strand:+ start:1448 stop:1669 length:222 start_codon:yes stop_codon:yes gene_type:complete
MPVLKSKRAVWESSDPTAHTGGRLYKKDLMKNKYGRIVSRKKHEQGKRMYKQNGLGPKTAQQMAELRAMRRRK